VKKISAARREGMEREREQSFYAKKAQREIIDLA